MQISATLLALTASASAAVLHRASPYGSWNVALNVNHEHDFFISATFTSDAYPVGLRNACVENSFATLPVAKRCDHLEFTFSYDGQTLNLTQTVEKPNKQTVFGSAYMPYTKDLGDGRIGASGVVQVTSAIV